MKVRVNISLSETIFTMAKNKGLNVSGICEDALREILVSFEQQTIPEKCNHKWTWAFATPLGLAKECVKCRTIKRVEIESHSETMKKATKIYEKLKKSI